MSGSRPLPAYCEDANSSDSDTQTDTRSLHRGGGHANVAAKRSHPSDLNHDKPIEVVGPDAASDSGYSSHTAATMSSADSAQSHQSSPPTSAGTGPGPSPSRRRPTLDHQRQRSSQNSPRRPLVRTGSSARRQDPEECTVPNCECKQSQSQSQSQSRSRRPQPSPLDSALEINYPPFDTRTQRSNSTVNYPPSPQSARLPPTYSQGSAIIQPASSVARRRTSSTSRPRPVSYHSGVPYEEGGYWAPSVPSYPVPAIDRGPPPSMSAHFAVPQGMPFPQLGQTPPNYQYPPGHPMYTPPYDNRPSLPHRNSSQYSTRRPSSQYGAPIIYHDQPYQTNKTIATREPPPSARYDTQPSAFDSSSSEEDSESEEETDRRRMPPPRELPPPREKPQPQRRPSVRQPKPDSYDRMTQSQTLPPRERESRPSRPSATAAPSRASSLRRPSLVQQAPKSVSYSNSAGNAKVVVEAAKSRRRQSYMGHERTYELEAKQRNHNVYRGETVVNNSQTRRRPTDVDAKRRDAEAYMRGDSMRGDSVRDSMRDSMRGDSGVPLTEQFLKAAKRSSRVPSGGSETGSTRSKNSHDRSSRLSGSGHTTTAANGEVRLRLDGSTNFNLEFTGGGDQQRTIRLAEAEDGTRELIIATPRGEGTVYHQSERGSISGRRPLIMPRRNQESDLIMPRREAEESSVRSRRASRSGRPEIEQRRPLRRREHEE